MKEIFKDIKDYDGLYQISNCGRVKSLKRNIILKPSANNKGYLHVILYKNGNSKIGRIHRLVAENFIPNPGNKPQINHIDGHKSNNNVNNLEWVTNSENQKHAFKMGLQTNKGNHNPRARKINQYNLNGELIKTWNSYYDITKELGINRSSIWRCCIGKYQKSHNYIWRYAE